MFHQCTRAYYHNYYGSWGGWRADADEYAAKTHRLKKLRSIESFVARILRDSLAITFLERKPPPEKLLAEARGHALAFVGGNINARHHNDSQHIGDQPDFVECFYGGMTGRDIQAVATSNLKALFANLADGFFSRIAGSIPYLDFVQFRKPVSFMFEGVKIWTAPDFLWRSSGELVGLNVFTYNPVFKGAWARKSRVDAMFAESLSPDHLPRVTSLFSHVPRFPVLDYRSTRKEMETLIKNDVDDMLAITKLDTDVREEAFEMVDDPIVCGACRFQELCGKEKRRFLRCQR
ncbi:MAG: hypothetical protein GXP32_03080 [Kiritimatiellaeota bacterium]|nr:hypothetical protein [Kiritimatiellota bacterium]